MSCVLPLFWPHTQVICESHRKLGTHPRSNMIINNHINVVKGPNTYICHFWVIWYDISVQNSAFNTEVVKSRAKSCQHAHMLNTGPEQRSHMFMTPRECLLCVQIVLGTSACVFLISCFSLFFSVLAVLWLCLGHTYTCAAKPRDYFKRTHVTASSWTTILRLWELQIFFINSFGWFCMSVR